MTVLLLATCRLHLVCFLMLVLKHLHMIRIIIIIDTILCLYGKMFLIMDSNIIVLSS